MTKPDLEYKRIDSLFTQFYPNTGLGEIAWNELCEQTQGTAKVFNVQLKSVLYSLRKSGYTVSKAKKTEMSNLDLLRELQP